MKIREMFKADINRNINGVIKVDEKDESSLKQELEEYVVTKELTKHFNNFYGKYENSLDYPTDKMAVWISGFFGSGKSHFLKMLSYLLSNKEVMGKKTIDYFRDKFDDPLMFETVERCAKVPTDAILFDIDAVGQLTKDDTVIVRVFAKVFYDYLGFYGDDLKVAKFEKTLSRIGKYDLFKDEFLRVHGDTWENSRESFVFFRDDVINSIVNTNIFSVEAATGWFDGKETNEISIDSLTDEIKEYVFNKSKDFRLLFMIDEIGQYIGTNGSLMLNLQSIVEELGIKCKGRVWVMVTAQEDIDSIIKVCGNDFSKIQGRFDTRLSLSSSSVDEVIKRRILAKTDNAKDLLKLVYEKNNAILKNLYTFNNSVADIKGYRGADDFAETYPFVPYQFIIEQKALNEIRKHGNSGKHLGDGARSMLSNYQETAMHLQDRDENTLAPFYLFYDSVHTFLESSIRNVIARCEKAATEHDVIEEYDVAVLKLLYLIRYVDDFKPNIENISILMIERIDVDKVELRKKIGESLERLYKENYVSRNGDCYTFLTDDEQDVSRDIRNTVVDIQDIIQKIGEFIFGDFYGLKKFKYDEKHDFDYDKIVDNYYVGQQTSGIKLRIITSASEIHDQGLNVWCLQSLNNNEAYVVLNSEFEYFEDLETALQIRKFAQTRNISQLNPVIQAIIRNRQLEATNFENDAREKLKKAILTGQYIVYGNVINPKGSAIKDKLDYALSNLVDCVYTKINDIDYFCGSEEEIKGLLNSVDLGNGIPVANKEAANDIMTFLDLKEAKRLPSPTMAEIRNNFNAVPYGWREIDIVYCVAELIHEGKITLNFLGNTVSVFDPKIMDYLRTKTMLDQVKVLKRVSVNESLIRKVRDFAKDYFDAPGVPEKEDDLISLLIGKFQTKQDECNELLNKYVYNSLYPGKDVLTKTSEIINRILGNKKDNQLFFTEIDKCHNDLLDLEDDLLSVESFFNNQVNIFDKGTSLLSNMKDESSFLNNSEVNENLNNIQDIINMERPYKRISEIPTYIQHVEEIYNSKLKLKKTELLDYVGSIKEEVVKLANDNNKAILDNANRYFENVISDINSVTKITVLEAKKNQLNDYERSVVKDMIESSKSNNESGHKDCVLSKSEIVPSTTLTSKEDIEKYTEEFKKKLEKYLDDNDTIHII